MITDSGTLGTTSNAGVQVLGSTTGISIIGNSIYDNRGIGIDLGTSGITVNDTGDSDTGANNLQNFPVITSTTVNAAGTTVTVSGTINSTASVAACCCIFMRPPAPATSTRVKGVAILVQRPLIPMPWQCDIHERQLNRVYWHSGGWRTDHRYGNYTRGQRKYIRVFAGKRCDIDCRQ